MRSIAPIATYIVVRLLYTLVSSALAILGQVFSCNDKHRQQPGSNIIQRAKHAIQKDDLPRSGLCSLQEDKEIYHIMHQRDNAHRNQEPVTAERLHGLVVIVKVAGE